MDGGEEVPCCLVVAGGDSAEEFEFGEEVFNQMACFVKVFVVFALNFAVGFGRNHRHLARLLERNQNPRIGIEALVGKQNLSLQLRQQHIGSVQTARLAAGEMKADGIAQRIDGSMNFGAQSALAASDRLIEAPFLRAPALC